MNTTHADIKKALISAAEKRGKADHNRGITLGGNPYDFKTQGDLYRGWEREWRKANESKVAA